MKFVTSIICFLILINCAPKALDIYLLNDNNSRVIREKRVPFKLNFSLSEKAKSSKFNILEIISSTLVGEVRLDIEGKMFPVELIYDYDEIQDLKIYKNKYYWSQSEFMVIPFMPSFLYANFKSDEYIVTGYLVKYDKN